MTKTIIPSDQRQEKRMANPGKNEIFVGSREGGPMEHSRTKQASIKHQNPEFFKRQTDRKHADTSMGQLEKYNKQEHKGMEMAMHANAMEKKAEHRDNLIKGYPDPKAGRGIGKIGMRDIDGGPGSGPQPGGGGGSSLTGNKPKGSLSANIAAAKAKLSPQQIGAGTRKHNAIANEKSKEANKLSNEHKGGEYGMKDIVSKSRHMSKDNIPARKDVPIQRNFNHHQKNVGNDPGRGVGQIGRDSGKKK